jgi:hypothetical protein
MPKMLGRLYYLYAHNKIQATDPLFSFVAFKENLRNAMNKRVMQEKQTIMDNSHIVNAASQAARKAKFITNTKVDDVKADKESNVNANEKINTKSNS